MLKAADEPTENAMAMTTSVVREHSIMSLSDLSHSRADQ